MPNARAKMTGWWMLVAGVAVIVCWASTAVAKSDVYQSDKYLYSVQLPEGWTAVDPSMLPPEAIEDVRRGMMNSPGDPLEAQMMEEAVEVDVFFKGPGRQPHNFAYATVVGYELPKMGIQADRVVEFFRDSVKGLEATMPTRKADFRRGFPELVLGEVVVDTRSLQYVTASQTQVDGVTLEGFTWAKTGKTRHVLFAFLAPPGHDASGAMRTFQETLRFHPDEVADGAQASRERYEAGKKVGVMMRYVLIAAVVVGGVVFLWRRRQARRSD